MGIDRDCCDDCFMHNASMSRDPSVAAQGRCQKVMTNAYLSWLESERERRTPPGILLLATASMCVSLMVSCIATTGRRDVPLPQIMRKFTPFLYRVWKTAILDLEKKD
jgi:hypothetical protein